MSSIRAVRRGVRVAGFLSGTGDSDATTQIIAGLDASGVAVDV